MAKPDLPEKRGLSEKPGVLDKPGLFDKLDQWLFDAIYSRNLVYNACWEDPAIDRQALALGADDTLLAISSAGCNVLDYALLGPKQIFAVDANPRQIALLELKTAGIRKLEFDDFFAIFGSGHHPDFRNLYRDTLREQLSPFAQAWWDKHQDWFSGKHGSFYFHGLSGIVARGVRAYFRLKPGLADSINALLDAKSLAEQQQIYDERVAPQLWNRTVNWIISQQFVMSLLGVPYPQRKLVEAQHEHGISSFIREAVEYVFRQLPLADNYFYRVYITGRYRRDCCPEYLKETGFAALKAGLVDRISLHTTTVTQFLAAHTTPISRFVLLDHMDWMSSYYPDALIEEWNAILARATPGARILLRSAQSRPAYLESIRVGPDRNRLREIFRFDDELAGSLQSGDRVHTYAGFVIADAPAWESLRGDFAVLRQMLRGIPRDGTHAQNLQGFYASQAPDYDRFRERLLHGRVKLIARLAEDLPPRAHVVELGGGTGRNLEFFGAKIADIGRFDLVDLCPALLARARERLARFANVRVVEADATTFRPSAPVDCVYFSYALTMIPDWRAALANACAMLKPGGRLGVVDFYHSAGTPQPGHRRHGAFARHFWRRWFAHDGVRLDPEHLATLCARMPKHELVEARAPVPYLPALRVPYYIFTGQKD